MRKSPGQPRPAPAGWTCRVAPWSAGFAPPARELLDALSQPQQALRDDDRSRVLLFETLPGAGSGAPPSRWVAKQPREKDTRRWNQATTWLRPGEAAQVFARSLELLAAAIPVPRPLALLERRELGRVVESWLWYEYAEGQAVDENHWPAIVALLGKLHQAGWRHRDPHLANWLQGSGGLVALDANPRRLRPGPLGAVDAAYDFVLLRNCDPRILPLLPGVGGWAWRWAEWRNARVKAWRRLKRRLRGRA
jgi:hypothetical protein